MPAQPRRAKRRAEATPKILQETEITAQFLQLVNESTGTRDLIRAVTTFFQQQAGCDAVGVRLQEGEDYPYYEARGFPEAFVRAENRLCGQDANGEPIRDDLGNPILACMCGNVICGRFDPAKPFFTPRGSFWANSSTRLLATTTEADRQGNTRNRCNGEGYESVALIPLRLGNDRLGLLQLNDRRAGRFCPELISQWERLADQLAIALAKFRADEALHESETRFRSLFDNMQEGFAFCRMVLEQGRPQDFIYLHVNDAFQRLTGLKNVTGRRVTEVIPGIRDTDVELFEIYGRVAATGQPEKFERYVRALKMWFSISVYCPTPGHFVAVFDVITARKEAEEQIRRLNLELEERVQQRTAQLEAANKELETFSYSVSHDLRAPLRHVLGYVEMLTQAAGHHLSEESRRYLRTIADASKEMGELIDDLLAFSRMGRAELRQTSVELDALVQKTLCSLETTTSGRNIVWKLPPLPVVEGDPTMLKLVYANLLGNAVKYTRPRDPAEIELGCAGEEDGRIILFVRDNGVGFDPQYVHKLFGVFQRLHRADQFEGTGIGLANVRRIIARHGGRAWAEGKLDEGATFYFTLKLSAVPAK